MRNFFRGPEAPRINPEIINDLRNVGPQKPLGYLPIETLTALGFQPEAIRTELESKGLSVRIGRLNFMYAYDTAALATLLRQHTELLQQVGWSADPDIFVEQVMSESAQPKTPLFDLIADAFADYNNRGRLHIKR